MTDGMATRAIHAGEGADAATGALNTPIYQTSTFGFDTAAAKEAAVDDGMAFEPGAFFYTRTANPTTAALEDKLADLEGAESASVQASGMAACATALLSVLSAGDHLVVADDIFVVTRMLLNDVLTRFGITVTHVDATDLDAVAAAIGPDTRCLFVETVSNPHMQVADLDALVELAHDAGLVVVADNTFLSPALLRPMDQGVDLVVHSATKYLCGHGDALAGVVAGAKQRVDAIRGLSDTFGTAISPFNSWLLLRGVRTLAMRMRTHSANALAVAELLEADDRVDWVRYPGLQSHPDHEVATRQCTGGFGGMIAMRLAGTAAHMTAFTEALTLPAIGVSLGDVHSLAYPMPKRDNLIRLSIGCEDVDDLLTDFQAGLQAVDDV